MTHSHVEILGFWDNSTELADAIGVNPASVRKWRQRGGVPSRYWPALTVAAKAKGKRLTLEMLAATQPARKAAA